MPTRTASLFGAIVACGCLISGCDQKSRASEERLRVVYVDVMRVAERHPAWRQAQVCATLGTDLRVPSQTCLALAEMRHEPAPARRSSEDTVSDSLSAVDHELEAFAESERAAAQALAKSREPEILSACQSGADEARRECGENLRRRLRAISEEYAERSLPIRLTLQAVNGDSKSPAGSEEYDLVRRSRADQLRALEERLASLEAERDEARRSAFTEAEASIAQVAERSKSEAQEQISRLKIQAEAEVQARIAEKRSAAAAKEGGRTRTAAAVVAVSSREPTDSQPAPSTSRRGLDSAAERVISEKARLQALAVREARAFVLGLAESRKLRVVFVQTEHADNATRGARPSASARIAIPDRTDEFVRYFSRRLAARDWDRRPV